MKTLTHALKEIKQLSPLRTYPKNTTICYEGETVKSIALIIKGEVTLKHYTLQGETLVLSTIKEGAFVGDYLIHHPEPYYPGNIETTMETTIQFIEKSALEKLLINSPVFRNHYLKQLSIKAIALNTHNKILSQKTIKEKVLLYLEQRIHQQNSLEITIPSKSNLSDYLNVARPSLHRTLKSLEADGFIELKPHKVIIKKDLCML